MAIVTRGLVVIVDPLSTGRLIAPLFTGLGFSCAAVLSRDSAAPFLRRSFRPTDFTEVIAEEETEQLERLGLRHRIRGAIAGTESGVRLADQLVTRWGLANGNHADSTDARRDKYLMAEQLRRCGVASIPHCRTGDVATAVRWFQRRGRSVVVKPLESAGSDGVHFCDTEAAVAEAVSAVVGSRDLFGKVNTQVLLQDDIAPGGVEYTVNSISAGGRHLITDVWRMRRTLVDSTAVCVHSDLVWPDAPEHAVLTDYCGAVLDALGVRYGPAHSEIMLTPAGPVLLETGARLEGSCDPGVVFDTLGFSQLSLLPAAYLHGALPRLRCGDGKDGRHVRHVYLLNREVTGPVRRQPALDGITRLPSFYSMTDSLAGLTFLQRTVNLLECPGNLYLVGATADEVERDYEQLRTREPDIYRAMVAESVDSSLDSSPAA